jgi:NADH:ubiquinone oxidoreductase subunit H
MKGFIVLLLVALVFSACFFTTRERRTSSTVQTRSCPPAYHWEDGTCVHNGKAKGHYK